MDKQGIAFLTVRVVLSIVVVATITGIFYIGVKNVMPTIEEGKVKKQVEELDSIFHQMVVGDARDVALQQDYKTEYGERHTYKFDLPSRLIYLGIGTDPDPNNDGKYQCKLTENGNVIVYKIDGRGKRIYWLDDDIKIRMGEYRNNNWLIKKPEEGLVITHGGKYEITFELVKYHDEKYILIYANNSVPYEVS